METRKIREDDYLELVDWLKSYNWKVIPPKEILPKNGFMAFDGEKNLAACYIYYANNAPFAFMSWYFTNRNATRDERFMALNSVVSACQKEANEQGSKFIFTYANLEPIEKMLEFNGFEISEQKVTMLIHADSTQAFKEDSLLIKEIT